MIGDSTFLHSGITALANVVYNRGTTTTIIVDNRITAMTGGQDHPGTSKTLMARRRTRSTSRRSAARSASSTCGRSIPTIRKRRSRSSRKRSSARRRAS